MPAVRLNGESHALPERATVADAVHATGATPDGGGVAVALDGEVVPRGQWAERELRDGAEVEVLHAVQGG